MIRTSVLRIVIIPSVCGNLTATQFCPNLKRLYKTGSLSFAAHMLNLKRVTFALLQHCSERIGFERLYAVAASTIPVLHLGNGMSELV